LNFKTLVNTPEFTNCTTVINCY